VDEPVPVDVDRLGEPCDRGGPALVGQMLMSPMLDDRSGTLSARQMAGRGVWDRTAQLSWLCRLLGG
jgi:hypothetical protein